MSNYSQAVCALDPTFSRSVEVRPFAAALLPGFCAALFIVALFQVLFLSNGVEALFRDSDTGWHVRNGQRILAERATPTVDPFSYSRPGAAWFSWEWLSDVALGYADKSAGLPGVALLAASAIALTVWGVARLSLWLGGNIFLTAVGAALLFGTTSIHWLARPHIFSWLLALTFLAAAEHERNRGSARRPGYALYALPVIACLWANMHGSFLLGPAILLIYAVGEWISGPHVENKGLRFAAASLASLAATFINPYGWRLHEHIFAYLQDGYLMDHIAEFRSFNFHDPGALYIELFFLAAIAGALLMIRQRAFSPALLSLGMLHLSFYAARNLPIAAVLLLPLCVVAFTRELEKWPNWRSLMDYSERLRAIDNKVWGVVPMAIALTLAVVGLNALSRAGRVGFSREKFPVAAADFLEKRGITGRVFARDQWGGYLIYRFDRTAKVFIDGRSDFYGQNLLEAQATVMELRNGWAEILKRYDVQVVLTPPDNALASGLRLSSDWKLIYTDASAAIFERTV